MVGPAGICAIKKTGHPSVLRTVLALEALIESMDSKKANARIPVTQAAMMSITVISRELNRPISRHPRCSDD